MRFMMMYKPADIKKLEAGLPPALEEIAEMGRLIEDMAKAGVLIATDGLMPTALGARIRRTNGKITVTDGPFTEAKELIAGFCMVKVKSKDEAIAWGKRFFDVVREDGESEIRQMYDVDDAPCAPHPREAATPA
ncbi:YciI family protein [Phreatobacter stygius]|uniref:YCII-related domain-containing protein n=1 Tax=Phreatobacter stygius TaxID=1940610 RepID=A0A4D7B947_9HYPH|nr:YciI family protein [Phreatobacter stygius]QCI67435.1 hypothetical protein E8M01_26335 [Phreatobacter stygius]